MVRMSLKNYPAQLLHALDNQRHLQAHCDVVLVSGNGYEFHAHSCVLAASSTFLNEQLKISDMTKQVSLADHDGEVIKLFLEVLYTGKLDLEKADSVKHLEQLKNLAMVIDVQSIVELCNSFMVFTNSLLLQESAKLEFTDIPLDKYVHTEQNDTLNEFVNTEDNSQSLVALATSETCTSNVTGKLEGDSSLQLKELLTQTSSDHKVHGATDNLEVGEIVNPETVKLLSDVVGEEMDKLQNSLKKDPGNELLMADGSNTTSGETNLPDPVVEKPGRKSLNPITGELESHDDDSDSSSDDEMEVLGNVADDDNEKLNQPDSGVNLNADTSESVDIKAQTAELVEAQPDSVKMETTESDINKKYIDYTEKNSELSSAVEKASAEKTVHTNEQINHQSIEERSDVSEKGNVQDTSVNMVKLEDAPTPIIGRPKSRPRKGTPHKLEVRSSKRIKQKKVVGSPVMMLKGVKKEEPVLLSPTGRPRRRAAEMNIYIGKPKPAIREENIQKDQYESSSRSEDDSSDAEVCSTPKTKSGIKKKPLCLVKKKSVQVVKRKHTDKLQTLKQEQGSIVGLPPRKRGRPRKHHLSIESDDDDEYTPSAKIKKTASRSPKKGPQELLFSDDLGNVYIEKDDDFKQTSVLENFSKITSQLLKYQLAGGPEKQAAETVSNYLGDLQEFEIAGAEYSVNLQEEIKGTFQEVMNKLQDYNNHQDSVEKNSDTAQQKQLSEDALSEWKTCRYCSKFKGKKKGRYEFHANYCNSNFRCSLCHKPFLNEHDLNKHHCNKMDRWICDLCGQILGDKPTLQLHKKTHLGIKNKMCSYCGKSFVRSCHLQAHIAHVHTKERPFRCSQCDAAFALKYELNRHMQRHTDTPNFMCTVCGVSFYERIKLNHHLKTKHCESSAPSSENTESASFILAEAGEFTQNVQHEEQVEVASAVDHIIHNATAIEQKIGDADREVHLVLHTDGFGYVAYQTP